MSEYCFDALKKSFDEMRTKDEFSAVTDADLRKIADTLDDIKFLAEKKGGNFKQEAFDQLGNLRRDFVNAQLKKKKQLLTEKTLRGRIFAEEGKEGQALIDLMGGGTEASFKNGRSVDVTTRTRISQAKAAFESDIMSLDPAAREVIKSGAIDREISIEVERLRKPESALADTGNEIAKAQAKFHVRTMDFLKSEIERSLGHTIGTVDDYLAKRVHDAGRISAAGYKQWERDIFQSLNLEETFGVKSTDLDYVRGELQKGYEKITKGSTADSTKSRSYVFKNLEEEFHYNQKYGTHSLYEGVHAAIDDTMRKTSLMDTFGPDYERGFNNTKKLVEEIEEANAKDAIKAGKKPSYSFWKDSSLAQAMFNNMTGKTYVGGDMYTTAQGIKGFLNLMYLSNAGIRAAFQNVMPAAMAARSVTGEHVFTTMGRVLGATKEFTENKTLSLKAGQMLADVTADMNFDLQVGASRPGMVAGKIIQGAEYVEANFKGLSELARKTRNVTQQKGAIAGLNNLFFKATGLEDVNKAYAGGVSRLMMSDFASVANKGFDELPAHTRTVFDRYGITEKHWNVMQLAIEETPSGMQYMSAQKIGATPDGLIKEVTGLKTKQQISAFRREVSDAYGSIITEATNFATTTPNARTQAYMSLGIPTDNPGSALAALMTQFKSFSVYQMQMIKQMGGIESAAARRGGASSFESRMAGGKVVGQYVAGSAAMWYLSQQLITLGQGKAVENNMVGTPGMPDTIAKSIENPLAGDVLQRAFVKSGALSIAGDVFDASLGAGRARNLFNYAAGPAIATGMNALEVGMGAAQGENKAKKGAALAKSFVPLQNFALTSRLIQPLVVDPLTEMISPAYVEQQRLRQMRLESGIPNE